MLLFCSSAIFLSPSKVDSLYDLIWLVGVNDFILKFAAVILKIFLVMVPTSVLPYQKRGTHFLLVERFFQLWRELAPIQVSSIMSKLATVCFL